VKGREKEMRTIWKYEFSPTADIQEFEMPGGAIPLCVNMQGDKVCMWCQVLTTNPVVKRKFCVVGTGHEKPEGCGVYIGSVFPHPFVWHIFTYK
jgi:hypothetical protein